MINLMKIGFIYLRLNFSPIQAHPAGQACPRYADVCHGGYGAQLH